MHMFGTSISVVQFDCSYHIAAVFPGHDGFALMADIFAALLVFGLRGRH